MMTFVVCVSVWACVEAAGEVKEREEDMEKREDTNVDVMCVCVCVCRTAPIIQARRTCTLWRCTDMALA